MPPLQTLSTVVIAGLVIFLCVTLLRKPLGCLLRLLLNTVGGFILLIILNYLGRFIGVELELSLFNAVVVGVLGLPGVGFLLILRWLLII